MAKAEAPKKPLLRDQQRALHAYDAVGRVPSDKQARDTYKIAVNDLGAKILRSGLCAAIASVQRLGNRADVLLGHLASAGVPGLEGATVQDFAQRVRALDADSYMMATRELLHVATWLKRAVQATFEET
ncbi:MAG: type III-B CRISPR module-associated protein Cmr5 [Polyangiaceae bacterium]|nr:type III-B CRISPR module-associated protein Cmr5 [Polyangiaceae bacterium]